ncbi:hypothetical protein ACSRUE_17910 [Sorangium sp. KYC3313]|uniref:hypothetical protein n=1 Tax=Sorangium sp. KYC3313 TaxID=3449740 RepID=UPI003F888A93
MNREAQDKLRLLRQRLAELEPYPWETIEAWFASAKPLIKSHFSEHFEEFKAVAAAPDWYFPVYASGGGGRWGGPKWNNWAEADARKDREDRKLAEATRNNILHFVDGLLNLPSAPTQDSAVLERVSQGQPIAHYYQGDFIMGGSKFITSISDSNIGAFGQGDNVYVSGSLTANVASELTQGQHRAAIKEAQKALIDDEDKLEPLVYEALGQFLRLARDIQVEQKSLAEVQVKMKEALDEVWAQKAAEGLRPQVLPKTLDVVGAIAKHPATATVISRLLGE